MTEPPTTQRGPGGPVTDPPGRWVGLAVLATALLLGMTTWFSATAVIPQLREEWALGPTASAWLTIAVQVGFVGGALASAVLNVADLVSPRRVMLLGSLGAAGANLALLTSPPVAALVALRLATGAFLAGVYPPALKAMATWFRVKRGTALGIMVGALTVGSAMPHLVNALGGLDWRLVIIASSVLTALGGLLAEYIGSDGPYPFPRALFDPTSAIRVFADRGVRLASLGYFGHMWELYAMWAWFGVFFADTLILHGIADPLRLAAYATFAVISVGALGCWVGGVLGDHWGRTRTTALAMTLSGSCAVVIGLVQSGPVPLVLGIGLVWGFWVVADSAQFSTVVTEVADQAYVGTAVTMQLAVGFTLTVSTIWLIPLLRDMIGWQWAFSVLVLGPALGTVSMLRLLRLPEAARIANGRG